MFGSPEVLVACAALGAVAVVAGVVGVVFFATGGGGALVESASEFGCPARKDAPDSPVVGSGETGRVSTGV